MARTNAYKATIKLPDPQKDPKDWERTIFVTAESVLKATNKLVKELEPDEELLHINLVSDECYV